MNFSCIGPSRNAFPRIVHPVPPAVVENPGPPTLTVAPIAISPEYKVVLVGDTTASAEVPTATCFAPIAA